MDRTEQSRVGTDHSLDLKILIVDDDRDTLDLLTLALEHSGAQVTVADSARQAIATLAQTVPDILISDLAMPEMDGCL
jgi:CheY-like chemotaxis protein